MSLLRPLIVPLRSSICLNDKPNAQNEKSGKKMGNTLFIGKENRQLQRISGKPNANNKLEINLNLFAAIRVVLRWVFVSLFLVLDALAAFGSIDESKNETILPQATLFADHIIQINNNCYMFEVFFLLLLLFLFAALSLR